MGFEVAVVGAGAGGAPVAARLSEGPGRRVLLLEAGPAPAGTEAFPAEILSAAMLSAAMPGHPNNWAFPADLTPHLTYLVARGRILGGSTALNGTYFVRARKADFDAWAALGNSEWTYQKSLPFYRRQENDLLHGDTEIHGGTGPMPVTWGPSQPHPITAAFAAACAELGFPFEPDKNAQGEAGYGPLPVNAIDGVRINTGIAYINPVRDRPTLTVRGDTLVRRILFTGRRVIGLEVETAGRVEVIDVPLVVLAAGAVKTPHLLALSGVGPAAELRSAGIDLVHDSPLVGKGFSDHPNLSLAWRAREPLAPSQAMFASALNFTSSPSTSSPSTSSPSIGDLEILPQLRPLAEALGLPAGPPDFAFTVGLQQAQSRGTITTTSADPHVQPSISYHYLSAPADRTRIRAALRTGVAILRSRAFASIFGELSELTTTIVDDDSRLDAWILAHLGSAIHACGGCAMGPDPGAVVDQYGRVRGVTGLRIADTSILPFAPSRGPAATAVMIGERIAEFIRTAPEANP